MRVAIVELSCSCARGESAVQLASALKDMAEVHLFLPTGTEQSKGPMLGAKRHEILPLSFPGHPWRTVLAQANPLVYAMNAKLIRRVAPDIVHFAVPHHANALVIPLLNVPFCITLYGNQDLIGRAGLFQGEMHRRSLTLANHLIVVRPSLREGLSRMGIEHDRVSVIPQGQEGFAQHHLALYRRMLAKVAPSGWVLYGE